MVGEGPVRRHVEAPAHREGEQLNEAEKRPAWAARAEGPGLVVSDLMSGPRKTGLQCYGGVWVKMK